eukprot:c4430_g1_i2.p1 GENE.c4430_g1_i2~~c4430_g1_i2.p1  ORF type:complete len:163 (+),score=56.88 c4430_g1_i2:70-558(+)
MCAKSNSSSTLSTTSSTFESPELKKNCKNNFESSFPISSNSNTVKLIQTHVSKSSKTIKRSKNSNGSNKQQKSTLAQDHWTLVDLYFREDYFQHKIEEEEEEKNYDDYDSIISSLIDMGIERDVAIWAVDQSNESFSLRSALSLIFEGIQTQEKIFYSYFSS